VKKRPDNHKTKIGKIDLLTNEPVYTQEYLDRLSASGASIEGMRLWDRTREGRVVLDGSIKGSAEIANDVLASVKDFGSIYLMRELSEKIGLLGVLREALPDVWNEVFTLANYLVSADKPVMYCEDWVASHDGLECGSMSSQRISDLLVAFGEDERSRFYQAWHKLIRDKEYIALDITSISSYSEGILSCEWGYNRDGEDLPQVNLCLLFGETSRLPVYQTIYSGSLRDVSTLRSTITEFIALTGDTEIMIVMDKGFYSRKNISMLLGEGDDGFLCRFLIAVPFTALPPKLHIEEERHTIDRVANLIRTTSSPIRGVRSGALWDDLELHAHVFYNPVKAVKERNDHFAYVASLRDIAIEDPGNRKHAAEFAKYLDITVPDADDDTPVVGFRDDVIEKELQTVGWFILLSNHIEEPQAAYDVYRMKDVVEKGFLRYKSNLGLDRLRVHGDVRMQNKVFVAFIALIISSAIQNTMLAKNLFKSMTFDKLLITLDKIKTARIDGKAVLRPLTKEQSYILSVFEIPEPDPSTLRPVQRKKRGRKPKGVSAE